MKKLMILPVIAILAFGSSSCKKSGDCVCTANGVSATVATNMSKADCDKVSSASGISCKIK